MSSTVDNTQTQNTMNKQSIAHLFHIVPEIKPAQPEYKFMYKKNNKGCWLTLNMGYNTFDECLPDDKDEARVLWGDWGFPVDEWTFFKVVYSYCGCNEIIAKGEFMLYNDDNGKIQVEYKYK